MKKLITSIIVFSLFLFLNPKSSLATCYPKNDWTGLCDTGSECSSGICCTSQSECLTANPEDYNYPTHDTTGTGVNVGDQWPGGAVGDVFCPDGKSIDTAIGCVSVLDSPEAFLGDILTWAVGIGGGIAFLLIVYASFMIMSSSGNPERLKAGQELLTSAIGGLILLVLSVFVLKFIGVDILKLCRFGFGTC